MTDTGPIVPHAYEREGEQWERCKVCGLAEAAHDLSLHDRYRTAAQYRCPYCVDRHVSPCPHGQVHALDQKGAPLCL